MRRAPGSTPSILIARVHTRRETRWGVGAMLGACVSSSATSAAPRPSSRCTIPSGAIVDRRRFASRSYPSLEAVIVEFLTDRRVDAAAFAVAGPVLGGRCKATNLPWHMDERELSAAAARAGFAAQRLRRGCARHPRACRQRSGGARRGRARARCADRVARRGHGPGRGDRDPDPARLARALERRRSRRLRTARRDRDRAVSFPTQAPSRPRLDRAHRVRAGA